MKYKNLNTGEKYDSTEEMYEEVYNEIDNLDLIIGFMNKHFSVYEIWDMLKDDKKCEIIDLVAQNYITNNIKKIEK